MTDPRTYAQLASLTAFTGQLAATELFIDQAFRTATQQAQLQSLADGVQTAYGQPIKASADHSISPEQYTAKVPTGSAAEALSYKRKVDAVETSRYKPKGL